MKIAFIQSNFPTSGNTFLTNRITGMIDLGNDVTILANAPEPGLSRLHEDIVKYDLLKYTYYFNTDKKRINKLNIINQDIFKHPLSSIRRLFKAIDRNLIGQELRLFFKSDGFRTTDRPNIKFPRSFLNTYQILKAFENKNFDIIYTHAGVTGKKFLFLKKLYPETKYVCSFIGYDFSATNRIMGVNYYRDLFEYSDCILTLSNYSKNILISLGCPEEKLIVHPLGVYTDIFTYKSRELSSPDELINFIIVARLVEKKAHPIVLKAFEKLASKYKNIHLHIVGSGPFEPQIKDQISNSKILSKHVTMHGWKSQHEVATLLDQSHIFLHPSITTNRWAEQEDTPTALLEAQAMGLPVISTFHAGIPEIVINGSTGFLVPERNEFALFEKMEQLVNNHKKLNTLGKNGSTWIRNNFNIEILNKKLNSHLLKIINI